MWQIIITVYTIIGMILTYVCWMRDHVEDIMELNIFSRLICIIIMSMISPICFIVGMIMGYIDGIRDNSTNEES